jgi:hypothetical protein
MAREFFRRIGTDLLCIIVDHTRKWEQYEKNSAPMNNSSLPSRHADRSSSLLEACHCLPRYGGNPDWATENASA